MLHAAVDSISIAPMLTGNLPASIPHLSNPFDQYKTDAMRHAWVEYRHVQGVLRFNANRRCRQIEVDALYQGASNPFSWITEIITHKKRQNFFKSVPPNIKPVVRTLSLAGLRGRALAHA